jgi:hypothetical protein
MALHVTFGMRIEGEVFKLFNVLPEIAELFCLGPINLVSPSCNRLKNIQLKTDIEECE